MHKQDVLLCTWTSLVPPAPSRRHNSWHPMSHLLPNHLRRLSVVRRLDDIDPVPSSQVPLHLIVVLHAHHHSYTCIHTSHHFTTNLAGEPKS
jgi:hypothetical protein